MKFRVIVVTDPPTHPQTNKQTNRNDYTAPQLARSVTASNADENKTSLAE